MGFFKSMFSSEDDNKLKVTKRNENNIYFRGKGIKFGDAEGLMEYLYRVSFFKETTSYDLFLNTPSEFKEEANLGFVMKSPEVTEEEKQNFLTMAGPLYILFPNRKISVSIFDADLRETNQLGAAIKPD
jgi:hypothetical protein